MVFWGYKYTHSGLNLFGLRNIKKTLVASTQAKRLTIVIVRAPLFRALLAENSEIKNLPLIPLSIYKPIFFAGRFEPILLNVDFLPKKG